MENQTCPCCGRHCSLTALGCERGENYLKSGGTMQPPYGSDRHGAEGEHRHCHGGHRHGHMHGKFGHHGGGHRYDRNDGDE